MKLLESSHNCCENRPTYIVGGEEDFGVNRNPWDNLAGNSLPSIPSSSYGLRPEMFDIVTCKIQIRIDLKGPLIVSMKISPAAEGTS